GTCRGRSPTSRAPVSRSRRSRRPTPRPGRRTAGRRGSSGGESSVSWVACRRGAAAALAAFAGVACSRPPGPADAGPDAAPAASGDVDLGAIARAEDDRRAAAVPADAQRSHDPAVRRAAARAYARILDADDAPLLRALGDDDPEVVAWAAYGLGEGCHGREDAHVRALGARLASLAPA